jgi:hypothetical protein
MGADPIAVLLAALLITLRLGLSLGLGLWAGRGGSVRVIGAGFLAFVPGEIVGLGVFLIAALITRRRLRRQGINGAAL